MEEINLNNVSTLVGAVKFGLSNMGLLADGAKKIRVKDVYLQNADDTLICEYISEFRKTLDVKTEISTIMSFCASFLKGGFEKVAPISKIAVKAFNEDGSELMFAISSIETAGIIASPNSLEWLSATYFQENTEDYRMSRAKTMISDIENGLRRVIVEIYEKKYGVNWWNLIIEANIRKNTEEMYDRNFGVTIHNGNVLINYTFTLDLKKIISSDWGSFRHLFVSKKEFEEDMVELNKIRRDEAHNRPISEANLSAMECLYQKLMTKIAQEFAGIEFNFMIENWKIGIKRIMENSYSITYTKDQFDACVLEEEKLKLILNESKSIIAYLQNTTNKLTGLKPPLSKKHLHDKWIELFVGFGKLEKAKLTLTQEHNWDEIPIIIGQIESHKVEMNEFLTHFLLSEA
jgi:hypothetical protein